MIIRLELTKYLLFSKLILFLKIYGYILTQLKPKSSRLFVLSVNLFASEKLFFHTNNIVFTLTLLPPGELIRHCYPSRAADGRDNSTSGFPRV